MNEEKYAPQIKKTIAEKLMNPAFEPGAYLQDIGHSTPGPREMLFEQYKLLVDSAHKIEERRGGSNNFFVSINTIFLSAILVNPLKLSALDPKQMLPSLLLVLIGMAISWDWLKVTASYKKLNFVNYSMIRHLETLTPTFVFSLRGEIEIEPTDRKPTNRGNIILIKENMLPQAFLLLYTIYLLSLIWFGGAKFFYS